MESVSCVAALELGVHVVARLGAPEMGEAGAGHEAVRRVRVVDGRQYPAFVERPIVRLYRIAEARCDERGQRLAAFGRGQREIVDPVGGGRRAAGRRHPPELRPHAGPSLSSTAPGACRRLPASAAANVRRGAGA